MPAKFSDRQADTLLGGVQGNPTIELLARVLVIAPL